MLPVNLTPVNSGIKYATPIYKVEIAATPLTVTSLGLDSTYYVFTGDTPAWTDAEQVYPVSGYNAVRPIISEYYFEGQPPTVPPLDFIEGERWAEQCSGYFVDIVATGTTPQSYNFYAAGEGRVQLTISGISVLNSLVYENNETFASGTISLMPGEWLPINIKYYQTGHLHNGFTILWQNEEMDEPIPISAGVTARTASGFAQWQELRSAFDIKVHKDVKETNTCSFSIPLASTLDYVGYQYNQTQKELRCIESGYTDIAIKKGYLAKVSFGFYYDSAEHWVSSLIGNIISTSAPRRANNSDAVEITICDFKFLCQQMSENYPQVDDYWNTYQIGDQTSLGGTHYLTPAFDNWRLDHVYKAMLIKAGIDPTLLIKRRTFLDSSNAEIIGNYLIQPSNVPAGFRRIYLEKQSKYGHPNSQDPVLKDADYLYKFNFGDKIIDIINNVSANFGYMWGFNAYYDGAPYLTAANNPITFVDQEDFAFRDHWLTESTESYAIGASVRRSNWQSSDPGGQAAIDITCTGTAFDLIVIAGYNYGYVDPDTPNAGWEIKRIKDSEIVATGVINTYHTSSSWAYYQGIDSSLGYNPSVISLASGLPYEPYLITVSSYCNKRLVVDGLFVYDVDYRTPVTVLRTLDTATQEGNIIGLNAEDSVENMCNDLIVIGRAKIKYDPGSNLNGSYVQSRAIDLDSIYNPDSPRFIGRRKQSLIIEKNISNEERADYIAYQGLLRTYEATQNVSVQGLGNPLIEEGDCIQVIDSAKNSTDPYLKKWVQSIDVNFDNSGYTQTYALSSIEPWPSYQPKPPTSSGAYGGVTIASLEIQNGGWLGTLASGCTAGATILAINNANKEYDRTFLVYREYPVEVPLYNIIKIDNEYMTVTGYQDDGSNRATLLIAERGVRSTTATTHASGAQTLLPYDPYFSGNEFNNKKVIVQYYLTQAANVCVEVRGIGQHEQPLTVANLTRPELDTYSSDPGADKYQYQDIGWHQFEWDGVDQFGLWNTSLAERTIGKKYRLNPDGYEDDEGLIGKGYFVVEANSSNYAKLCINIDARDATTGESLENLSSQSLSKTTHPASWGTPGQQYIYTSRGPMLNVQFTYDMDSYPNQNDDGQWNNLYGSRRFDGSENSGRGPKIIIKSIAPSTWDPPRFIVYEFGYKGRHITSVQGPFNLEYGIPHLGMVARDFIYDNPSYWGNFEMSPIDAYRDNQGINLYLPVNNMYNYTSKNDAISPSQLPQAYTWDNIYRHSWAFYLGGPHGGEARDRSGRYYQSYGHWITWCPDTIRFSGSYYHQCSAWRDLRVEYLFGDDSDPNGDNWGHHKLHAWEYREVIA